MVDWTSFVPASGCGKLPVPYESVETRPDTFSARMSLGAEGPAHVGFVKAKKVKARGSRLQNDSLEWLRVVCGAAVL